MHFDTTNILELMKFSFIIGLYEQAGEAYLSPFINYRNCSLALSVAFRSFVIVLLYLKKKSENLILTGLGSVVSSATQQDFPEVVVEFRVTSSLCLT